MLFGRFFMICLFTAGMLLLFTGCGSVQKKLSVSEIAALQPSGQIENDVRVIKVEARKFEFIPDTIVVRSGEIVRLEVTSTDVEHGIAIPDYKINQSLKPNKTEAVLFIAGEKGEYPIHCSVFCGLGHTGMKAKLVVLAAGN